MHFGVIWRGGFLTAQIAGSLETAPPRTISFQHGDLEIAAPV